MLETSFATLPVSAIATSLTNPRKTFNQAKLQELADSIKASGVHQPILARPLPGSRVGDTDRAVTHELVSGERRLRACALAGVPTIPAMIRELDDAQVREIQIIENLQRDDLSELEEAEGYEALMQASEFTADQVAAKIGKSRSYVYARLKLLDLCLECKTALREGQIDASRALLLARIPDSQLQIKALAQATIKSSYTGELGSVRELQAWLQRNVMLRLEDASFKITDARLVAAAGSCKDCPKRTGANPDLFADVAAADVCTDPACFHGKEEAHRNALRHMAEKKGMRIVEGDEAREMLGSLWSNRIDGYCPLTQVRNDIAAPDGSTGHTLRELLGPDAPGAILLEHPRTKELIEAVPEDEAEAVLLAKGLLKMVTTDKRKSDEEELKHLQQMAERDTKKAVRQALFDETKRVIFDIRLKDAAELLCAPKILRAWLHGEVENRGPEDMAMALGYTFADGEDEADGLAMHINRCDNATLYRAMVLTMLLEDSRYYFTDVEPTLLNAAMDHLRIDVKAITKTATLTVRAEYADRIKKIKFQIDAQKLPAVDSPAAQARGVRGGDETKPAKNPGKRKSPAAPKMSEQEAKLGIAAAMQGMEQAQTSAPESEVSAADRHATRRLQVKSPSAKYRGPNGETWSGRGLMPRWLQVLIDQGGTKEQYQVQEVAA